VRERERREREREREIQGERGEMSFNQLIN